MSGTDTDLVNAAIALGASYSAVYRLVLTGALKAERRNGRWRVDQRDLQRLVRERAQGKSNEFARGAGNAAG